MSLNPQVMERNMKRPKTIMGPSPERTKHNKWEFRTPWVYQFGKMYGVGTTLRHMDDLLAAGAYVPA